MDNKNYFKIPTILFEINIEKANQFFFRYSLNNMFDLKIFKVKKVNDKAMLFSSRLNILVYNELYLPQPENLY